MTTDKSLQWRQSKNASFARHSENRTEWRVVSGFAARVTTPLALASDTVGFAAWLSQRQAIAWHRASRSMARVCLQGEIPLMEAHFCDALCRGRKRSVDCVNERVYFVQKGGRSRQIVYLCANYYSVIFCLLRNSATVSASLGAKSPACARAMRS